MIKILFRTLIEKNTIKGLYCGRDKQIEIFLKEIHDNKDSEDFEKKLNQVIEHEALHHAFYIIDEELNSEDNVNMAQEKIDTTIIYRGLE